MNLSVNSIYQAKLNEIQSRIPNISSKTANFSECLQKATENNATNTENVETNTTTNTSNTTDSLALLSLLSSNPMYNTASLFSDSGTSQNDLSNLTSLLALQQYNNNK